MLPFKSTASVSHLVPGVAQVVSISVGDHDKSLYGVNVLLLHFCDAGAGSQQRKPGQCLNVGIPLQLHVRGKKKVHPVDQVLSEGTKDMLMCIKNPDKMQPITNLHVEDAGDPNSAADALQTQRRHFLIITVLKSNTERRQQGRPGQL